MTTLPTLLPSEQRIIDALELQGFRPLDQVNRAALECVSRTVGWDVPTIKRELNTARRVLREQAAAMTLTPREERLVDELEALGYAVYQRLDEDALLTVAAQMELSLSAVRNLLNKVRRTWKVEAQGLKRPSSALLPEAPTLPLGCTDPVVIARCQQGRPR